MQKKSPRRTIFPCFGFGFGGGFVDVCGQTLDVLRPEDTVLGALPYCHPVRPLTVSWRVLNNESSIILVNLIFHFEIVQQGLVVVLCSEAGITKIAVGITPVLDTSIIVQTQFVGDDKRHLCVLQTLPEEQ